MPKHNVSANWPVQSVSNLFDIGSGNAAQYRPNDFSGPFLVYGANGPIGSYDRANYGPGYVIGRVGTAGEVTKVNFRIWASDNTLTATPKAGRCDHDFGGFLLEFLNLPLLATKNAQPLLTQTNIASLSTIVCENIEEQRRIAEILDTIDQAIQRGEALIEKLRAMKQGLLHDLLTRGLDENGQLRNPKTNPEQFKDSLFGAIPISWKFIPLADMYACPARNGLYKTAKYYGSGYAMIHMPQMFRSMVLDESDAVHVQVTPSELEGFGLQQGDLLFARRSLNLEGAGKCILVAKVSEPMTFESSIIRVRLRSKEIRPEFVNHFLNSEFGFRIRRPFLRQVAVSGVSSEDISRFHVVCPPVQEQDAIIWRLEKHDSRIRTEEQYLNKLKLQKKGLMHDLLTGKVRVKV
jgi:type I restriction enzyme S subunit